MLEYAVSSRALRNRRIPPAKPIPLLPLPLLLLRLLLLLQLPLLLLAEGIVVRRSTGLCYVSRGHYCIRHRNSPGNDCPLVSLYLSHSVEPAWRFLD